MALECPFCDLETIRRDDELVRDYGPFYLKVGKGVFTPGHVLLIPKGHTFCFGEVPESLDDRLIAIKRELVEEIEDRFSHPIIYEHGVYGQTVLHGHLQILPRDFGNDTLVPLLHPHVSKEFPSFSDINNPAELRGIYQSLGGYLGLEEIGHWYVYEVHSHPNRPAYFRNLIAKLTRSGPKGGWKDMTPKEKEQDSRMVLKTKELLRR